MESPASAEASRFTFAGVFMVALATLMHELLLTRIFSVTMWYHFAFVAISVAMFGMTVGALLVYLWPALFPRTQTKWQLAAAATAFPIAIVISFLTQLSVPFIIHPSVVGIYSIVFTYAVISVPFIASGICMCLALTRFPRSVSQLYAADLLAAAVGCLAIIGVLRITDAPTAVLVVAFLASLGAVSFAWDVRPLRLRALAVASTVLLGLSAGAHMVLVWHEFPILRILYTKGGFEARPLYEKWNSYSRVQVNGDPNTPQHPYARTLSPTYPHDRLVRQLRMDIDVAASTTMTAFSGDLHDVDHMKYDVTTIGEAVRHPKKVLIVGTGGGRDILGALAFGAQSVIGVELNRDIIGTLNGRFGDFTGHLDRYPGVRFVNAEARSYIAGSKEPVDFIQISLIDTWAATAAGAFALSENALYTVDAWKIFLTHLTDRGLLSVCRWYLEGQPAEVYRTVALASASLRAIGVQNPRDHIVVVRSQPIGETAKIGVGTLLVSRTPFTQADLDTLDATVSRLQFTTILSPRVAEDDTLAQLASGRDFDTFVASYPLNIAPPTDDSPFFFNMLRLRDIFRPQMLSGDKSAPNITAVIVLGALLFAVLLLTTLCIVVPLALTSDRRVLAGSTPLLAFFAAIGLGFMLIETSQMQRLIVVLGHPMYALSVVLTTLLVSSGIGSFVTRTVPAARAGRAGTARLVVLVAVLVVAGLVTPAVTRHFEGSSEAARILSAILVLAPPGFFMGMMFPLGMKLATEESDRLTPWLWGINGAFSVCASVLAVVIALATSISAAFWSGVLAYAIALAAFRVAARALPAHVEVRIAAAR